MLFRQLNTHHQHTGSVAEYYFVKRDSYAGDMFLLTKDNNGWGEDQVHHYTNFRLEVLV